MDDTPEVKAQDKKEVEQRQKSNWFDPLIKIVQELLDFNMKTYTEKKAPPL